MQKNRGFTLIELLVVVAIIALLIAILLPSLARAREAAKRGVCGQNVKGISTACKTYAFDNQGWWPTVPSAYESFGIPVPPASVWASMGGVSDLARNEVSGIQPTVGNLEHISPSRALWLLIRRGQLSPKNYICPSSNEETLEEAVDFIRFYDFKGYGYCSYGYQVSVYPKLSGAPPRDNLDPRVVFLADKNPCVSRHETAQAVSGVDDLPDDDIIAFNSFEAEHLYDNELDKPEYEDGVLTPDLKPNLFAYFNSPNHGGRGNGEGQSIGRADGSVIFAPNPLQGVDGDNIYSAQNSDVTSNWTIEGNVWTGRWGARSGRSVTPGHLSFDDDGPTLAKNCSTDTLLFP